MADQCEAAMAFSHSSFAFRDVDREDVLVDDVRFRHDHIVE